MPFLEHVRELRRRVIVCAAALLIVFIPLWFVRIPIVEVLKDLGGSASSEEVTDLVIDKLGISEKEQSETGIL